MQKFTTFLADYWSGATVAGQSKGYRLGLRQRAVIVSMFTPVSVVFLLVYGFAAFTNPDTYWYGYILVATLVVIVLNIPIARLSKNVGLAANVLVFLGIPVLLPWLITGGPLGQGYFWTLVYVVWAFLLVGRTLALYWLGVYFALSVSVLLFGAAGYLRVAYSWLALAQVAFMAALIFTLLAIYDLQSATFEKLAFNALDALEKQPKKG